MSTWVAALIATAAVTVTYFSCLRPMLRGRGHCAMTDKDAAHRTELDRHVAELREELRVLRAENSLNGGRVSDGTSAPPTEV